ncbi:MAG: manganese/zinc/iron transport system permease protein [Limisphaerales bacterium]|jgi:manganese/zinc/iron transport system permease protein
MNSALDFLSFSDPNVQYVVLGTILMGASAAVIGTFAFLRKRALVGDAIAHSVLPGICLAFMLSGTRSLYVLLPGAFVTGWLSLLLIDLIAGKTRIKADAAIGLVLSIFFGVGILLLTSIQRSGNASQAGLDHFLFGKAAAIVPSDIWLFGGVAVLLIGTVILFFKDFKLLSFDPDFAQTSGLPVRFLELLLSTLTVMAVVTGIQAVGVVLMAALLITPAAAARYWTDKLWLMIIIGALFASLSGFFGSWISYENSRMPTGPWIIVILSLFAFASMIVAPNRGWITRQRLLRNYRKKIIDENILKAFYKAGEQKGNFDVAMDKNSISEIRDFDDSQLQSAFNRLLKKNLLKTESSSGYQLTQKGREEGTRLVRLHRLWELYLTQVMRIQADHVHDDAEAVEHLLTPEMEAELEEALGYPEFDPHQKLIPR